MYVCIYIYYVCNPLRSLLTTINPYLGDFPWVNVRMLETDFPLREWFELAKVQQKRWTEGLKCGKRLHNYGKSPFLMGKLTISMAIFNSYVKLPEGKMWIWLNIVSSTSNRFYQQHHDWWLRTWVSKCVKANDLAMLFLKWVGGWEVINNSWSGVMTYMWMTWGDGHTARLCCSSRTFWFDNAPRCLKESTHGYPKISWVITMFLFPLSHFGVPSGNLT